MVADDAAWSTARQAERWHVHRGEVGGWCVSTDPVPPLDGGRMVVAECPTEEIARYVAESHNRRLDRPLRGYLPAMIGAECCPTTVPLGSVRGGDPAPGDRITVYYPPTWLIGDATVVAVYWDEEYVEVRVDRGRVIATGTQ